MEWILWTLTRWGCAVEEKIISNGVMPPDAKQDYSYHPDVDYFFLMLTEHSDVFNSSEYTA